MASNYFNPINILNTSNSQGLGSGGSLNVGGGISIGGDTYIGGKVAISGTTTSFADNILILNDNPSASSDTGILLQRFSQDVTNNNNYSGIIYSETTDEFNFGYATADTRGSLTLNSFIPIRTNRVTITQGGLNATGNSNTVGSIFTTGGNVGIGTNSPVDTLDVRGTLRIGNSTQSNSIIFAGTNGDNQSITTGVGYTLIGERVYNSTEQSELLLFKGNDITSPAGPDRIRLLAAEHRFDILTSGISGSIDVVGSNTSGSNKMIITTNGNIGINTTSPNYTLDVNGTLNITTLLTSANITGVNYTGVNLLVSNFTTSNANIQTMLSNNLSSINYINSYGNMMMNTVGTRITTNIKTVNNRIRTSRANANDAVTIWTTRTLAANNTWTSICWSPDLSLFVAVARSGTGNRVMTSPDGINWTTRTSAANNSWNSVVWSSELSIFVAVAYSGTGNRVMTSSDGITWTTRTSAANNAWLSVVWSAELSLFVAVATSGTGNCVMTSPNGINWTTRASAADNWWQSVTWSPELSLFVAVSGSGTGNRVMTSPDGITWTTRASAADYNWYSVCWSSELYLFVAVAKSGTGNRVMTSSDGITWTTQASAADNDWTNVIWSSELSLFVAVAESGVDNRVMTSSDGIKWTIQTTNNSTWNSICWSPELSRFVAVAPDFVMTSQIALPNSKSTLLISPAHLTATEGNVNLTGSLNINEQLDVKGNIIINNPLDITAALIVQNSTGSLQVGVNDSTFENGASFIWDTRPRDIRIGTNNIEHIRVTSSGNIGIGTTSPISKLDINGSLSISGTNGSVTLTLSTEIEDDNIYILPSNIPTTANTYLTSNSSGNMSWKLPYQIGDIAPKQMDSTFVQMNGQVLSQSTYPDLYAAIGHNPEIKFNIKNLTQTLNTTTLLAPVVNIGRENIARNNNTIIVVGTSNAIFRSADNGVTWTHPAYYNAAVNFTTIDYCAGTWNRWILGANGAVLADSTDDGITWTLRSNSNYTRYAMDFNPTNSIGIVVGASGNIQRSTNATTWSTITALNTNTLRSIVYANISGTHTWVTVGDSSTIGYSTNDGATFTLATGITAGIQFNIVIWVGGSINLFIAGGNSNNLWTSPDGITWTSRSGVAGNVQDMVKDHTDSYIVAATSSGVARSTDGTTWTSTTLASINSISYDSTNTTFLGVGASRAWYAKVATFSTWTEYTTTFNRTYRASIPINGGGSILYTIDTGGIINFNTSTNTESTVLSPVYSIKDIAYGNGIFVAISSDGLSSCFTSTDGNTWTYRRFNTAVAQNAFAGRRIKYLNGNFIILSTSTIIFTSTDGITWTQRTTPNTTKNDVIWTGTNYVACTSDNGQLIYSSNLSTWTAVSGFGSSVGTGIIIEDLTHLGNGTIIAVARFGCILKSTDHGVSWSLKRAPSISIYDFCSVAYSATDNELVAVTRTTNQIAYSTDQGDTWQTYQADTNYAAMQFNGVIQGNNDFIVYGRNSLMGFSSSGVTWEWTSPGGNFEIIDMIYADGVFVGAGLLNSATLWSTPIVVYSTNGKNWTIKSVPHSLVDNALPKQRIGYGNKKFILSSYLNLVSTNVWVGELQYDPSTEFQLSTQYFGSGNTKMWIKASN